MTREQPRLVVHMGVPKTGSSALQVAFVRNRERLWELGVHYPTASSDDRAQLGKVMTGNGVQLLPFLTDKGASEEVLAGELEHIGDEVKRAGGRDVLYSSETLFGFLPDRIAALDTAMRSRGVVLHAAVFVRDRAGHAWSAYSQSIKRRKYTGSFSDFLSEERTYNPRWRLQLERLLGTLGHEQVQVLHYDSNRSQLIEAFMGEVLGVLDSSDFDVTAGQVNRSLSRTEMNFMRYINKRHDGPASALLDDMLQRRRSLGPTGMTISGEELALLDTRFGEEVEWVNHQFFTEPVLRVAADPVPVATLVDEDLTDNEAYLLDCLVDLINTKPRP